MRKYNRPKIFSCDRLCHCGIKTAPSYGIAHRQKGASISKTGINISDIWSLPWWRRRRRSVKRCFLIQQRHDLSSEKIYHIHSQWKFQIFHNFNSSSCFVRLKTGRHDVPKKLSASLLYTLTDLAISSSSFYRSSPVDVISPNFHPRSKRVTWFLPPLRHLCHFCDCFVLEDARSSSSDVSAPRNTYR